MISVGLAYAHLISKGPQRQISSVQEHDNDDGNDDDDDNETYDKTWIRGGMPSEVRRGVAGARSGSMSLRKPDDDRVTKISSNI